MRFYLSTGYGYSIEGYKESYMVAEENAYSVIEEGVEEWLEENIVDCYSIESDIVEDENAQVDLYIEFQDEADAMAYRLRWE